jgi:hypothetical protein
MKINAIKNNNCVNFGTRLPKQTEAVYECDGGMHSFLAKDYWPEFVDACVEYKYTDKLEKSLEKLSTNNVNDVLGLECVRTQKGEFSYNSRAGGFACETPHKMDIFLILSDSSESLEKARKLGKYRGTKVLCAQATDSTFVYGSIPGCGKSMCEKILENLENFISAGCANSHSKARAILSKYREI